MKISYNWLREYVDVKNSAKMVAEWLTMAGLEVTSVKDIGKDAILEIEVTTNRPDWLSVVGVAKEVSVITGKHLKSPKIPRAITAIDRSKQIDVEILDKLLCPRYTGRIIDKVNVAPSPEWLKARLEAIGLRPVNNVVDITNFCLFELGQPLHAFDYDKLIGKKIVVRNAKNSERIVTIDKVERELDAETLVIADEKRPVAIAGIMGGLDTEVNESTKTVLLESASFSPISVRRTQRRLGLTSDSSYRFERGVDLNAVLFASDRATNLIVDITRAKLGVLKDVGTKSVRTNYIKLSVGKVNRILNLTLTAVTVKRILEKLGLMAGGAQGEMRVEIPSFRRDLKREEDLIEEIARVYGYDKIPTTIPKMVGHTEIKKFQRKTEELTREILVGEGLNEIVSYSLISTEDLKKLEPDTTDPVLIKNPLSNQQEAMRSSLIPGALNAARFNINRKAEDVGIFELSKVYLYSGEGGYKEESSLCILMSGKSRKNWRQKKDVDFFDIKGAVETLFEKLGISSYEFSTSASHVFYPGKAAQILIYSGANKTQVGLIGEVKKSILESFDIKKEIFVCEIRFERLFKFINVEKRFIQLPKFLPVKRDISLIVENDVRVERLLAAIKETNPTLIRGAELSDEYFGKQIPAGKKGLTFSVEYLDDNKQLTEEEIEKAHNVAKEAIVQKFGAQIR